ncbi:MAG: Coenzyme F420 hydrogenase/dehydrogenase, beta subunit C-terminal domain [Lachnospiraceae bacterium]|nr:Coenzyme F420 hydrogenase/dehydrogenase, beta subunit C-terminal domain [Candidatus Colinaster equi]
MGIDCFPVFYAAVSRQDSVIGASSSGGIYYELCNYVISQNGIVYGAAYSDSMHVHHIRCEQISEISATQKSKYMRSNIEKCYNEVLKDLGQGRIVLFSGTGCQIAGLKRFVGEEYDRLITCEVVCHGAPLNIALEKYIEEKQKKVSSKLKHIDFRDKRNGWSHNCILECYANGNEDVILSCDHMVHKLYLDGINMEKACGLCKYQRLPRIADITLADFWRYAGEKIPNHGDRGISLVAINSEHGNSVLRSISDRIFLDEVTIDEAIESCRHMSKAPYEHPSRDAFEFFLKQNTRSYSEIYDLFSEFGEVVLPDSLRMTDEIDEQLILETFLTDTHEIVYLTDSEKGVKGVITFGEFLANYPQGNFGVNYKYKRVYLNDECVNEIRSIFDKQPKINRIPVLDESNHIVCEVRRWSRVNGRDDKRKFDLLAEILEKQGIHTLYIKRPDIVEGFEYSDMQRRRMEEKLSFSQMLQNYKKYESELNDVLRKKTSEKYLDELGHIPPIVHFNNRYYHIDSESKYINVIDGKRRTCATPNEYEKTVVLYGRCGVFGYAVEDNETISSRLQERCNESAISVRVINNGLWGGGNAEIVWNIYQDIITKRLSANCIVIIYMNVPQISNQFVSYFDTTEYFHMHLNEKVNFYDIPGHMNADGYSIVADYIFGKLEEHNFYFDEKHVIDKRMDLHYVTQDIAEIDEYICTQKKELGERFTNKTIGAIVMNCNPFTKGHYYLISEALRIVDELIVFVVEENRSQFEFDMRFEMVKAGVVKLKNVHVIPSGKFIISTKTFPEYFTKETRQTAEVCPVTDVTIFAEYIAPAFNISKRFVGTEPIDSVTNCYNRTLREILPQYGVEVIEIPRLQIGGEYVSASLARNAIIKRDIVSMKQLLPQSTIDIIGEVVD